MYNHFYYNNRREEKKKYGSKAKICGKYLSYIIQYLVDTDLLYKTRFIHCYRSRVYLKISITIFNIILDFLGNKKVRKF